MPIRSGALAKLAGVSSDTLRYYERLGVLARPGRAANNYRVYPEDAVARVRLIQRALDFGFSLAELANVLRERDSGGRPCRKVRLIAEAKLNETEVRLEELTALRDALKAVLADWDKRLDTTAATQRAHLLDALSSIPAPNRKGNAHAHRPSDPVVSPSRLSGHWSHESHEKRTPAARRQER